jgi:adenylate cyclase
VRADPKTKLIVAAALAAALLLDAGWGGVGERLELALGDRLVAAHAAGREPDPEVVVIAIDERSLVLLAEEFGRYPWPRSAYAELAEGLASEAPAALVFDITFTDPDRDHPDADAWFAEVVTSDPRTYLPFVRLDPAADAADDALELDVHGAALGFSRTSQAAAGARAALLLPFESAATTGRIGAINFLADVDGVGRRYHTDLDVGGWLLPSMPARLARDLAWPEPPAGQFEINWRGVAGARPAVPFADALTAVREGRSLGLAGKVVLIGSNAQGLGDVRTTPLSGLQPGIEVLAAAIETLKAGDAMHRSSPDVAAFAALCALALVVAASIAGASPLRIGVALLLLTPAAAGGAYAALDLGFRLAWVQPAGWAWFAFVASAAVDWLLERRAREHTERVFSRFVDSRVVADLVRSPDSALERGGELIEVTVLFSDIRGFTSYAESRPPADVVAMLNRYFSRQVEVVFRHGGTVDKFIGDAIMAFWGAPVPDPQHAAHAVAAALEMAEVAAQFERELAAGSAEFGIGIGLHSGPAVVGFIGSQNRLDYTAIGDTVNLASRIEGCTKGVATVLVSSATRDRCGAQFRFEDRGRFKVKGRDAEVELFEPRAEA